MSGANQTRVTTVAVVGGLYHERCIWPAWDQLFGSGGRAATALTEQVAQVTLHTYARSDALEQFRGAATVYGFDVQAHDAGQVVTFEYVHSLSDPIIHPSIARIQQRPPIVLAAQNVVRFGMLEGTARVDAQWCVYDPQSAFAPEAFAANGSKAAHLAVVANRAEVLGLTGEVDPESAARVLLGQGVEVVVVKEGAAGALVVHAGGSSHVPAFQTEHVWKIGSGDVFAAMFGARWCVHGDRPEDAARWASMATASYVDSMALPPPSFDALLAAGRREVMAAPGRVYLAAPFFTLGERWVVDEARRCLREMGLEVLSPIHDIGLGPAETVAPADIEALTGCDRVFAILDGLDSGTIFEIGYATARGVPTYGLAQNVAHGDLKMLAGTGCQIYDDFVTAIHHAAWRA